VDLATLLDSSLHEHTVREGAMLSRNKVLLVDVSGVIDSTQPTVFSMARKCSPDTIKSILDKAEDDKAVKAVILRLDTPGGAVTPSDTIYREVADFRRRTGIPVYSCMMGICASGGYYISAATDKIYAHPTSVTGSIGVIARFPKFKGLADKVGYEETIIKSGGMKAMGHPLRDMSEEELKIAQNMIDDMYSRFVEVVVDGRKQFADRKALEPIADGRVYTAKQALKNGLIDEIGYLDDVIDDISIAAGISNASVVTYLVGSGSDATIYSSSKSPAPAGINLDLRGIVNSTGPGFYYLWAP
jgi:protease-4